APDGIVKVPALELDPDAGIDGRHHINSTLCAGHSSDRYARQSPSRGDISEKVADHSLNTTLEFGIDVVEHHPPILPEEFFLSIEAHGSTRGVSEINPSRPRLKLCLYSPRLML